MFVLQEERMRSGRMMIRAKNFFIRYGVKIQRILEKVKMLLAILGRGALWEPKIEEALKSEPLGSL